MKPFEISGEKNIPTEKTGAKAIPVGRAGAMEKKKETLPAVEVENKVLWINPDFPELPFNIKEGEASRLGLFLTPALSGDQSLEATPKHKRSAILGRVVFRDRQRRIYRDVDLKGVGFLEWVRYSNKPFVEKIGRKWGGEGKSAGIMNLADAYKDKETSEAFLEKGIRTHRVLAIINLKEVVDKNGHKIKIEDAKRWGILQETDKPVVEVRACGTKMRLANAADMTAVEDARLLVAGELGENPEKFSRERYFNWMVKNMATQVALMHKNGWFHGYLSDHNITLDGRIVDLDSVGWLRELPIEMAGDRIRGDISNTITCLFFFGDARLGIKSNILCNVEQDFDNVYREVFCKKNE
jgi:hypothetical protein